MEPPGLKLHKQKRSIWCKGCGCCGQDGDGDNEYECQIVTRSSAIGFTIS